MDYGLIKYHMQELKKIIEEEPNFHTFASFYREIETLLNSYPLKDTEVQSPEKILLEQELGNQ